MSTLKNLFKKIMLTIAVVLGSLVLIAFLFKTFSPQFGGKSTKAQKESY